MTASAHGTLSSLVDDAMQTRHVPGVAVGLLHDGTEETFGFGVTSVENPLPVQPDTLFQIGSITKTFTATLLMQLVAAGRLQLDAPIRAVLPDFRLQDETVAAAATVRHLLTHTGGWVGDDFTDTGWGDDALARYVLGMAALPQLAPLGGPFSYCNSGFAVAGRIVEVLTGQTYEQAARERLLDPLEMQRSRLFPTEVMTERYSVGHTSPFDDGQSATVLRPWPLPRAANAMGGLTSTVIDLLRYARLHLGQAGDAVLPAAARAEMHTVWAPAGNFADAVGAAWMLSGPAERRVVQHSGSTYGQQATLQLVPDRGLAVAVLTNGSRGGEVHQRISRWALEQYAGISQPDPTVRQVAADELAEYVGRYEQPLASIELRAEDGYLVVHEQPKGGFPSKDSPPRPAPPAARLAFWATDRVLGLDPPFSGARAEFLRGADGALTWLRIGGRLAKRQPSVAHS